MNYRALFFFAATSISSVTYAGQLDVIDTSSLFSGIVLPAQVPTPIQAINTPPTVDTVVAPPPAQQQATENQAASDLSQLQNLETTVTTVLQQDINSLFGTADPQILSDIKVTLNALLATNALSAQEQQMYVDLIEALAK